MFQVFRISGIPVRIDVSWLLVFALISWSLAAGYFPRVMPELSPGAAWVHGVGAALALFASVFLHELAHALVALQQGMRVTSIRLHIFGGVSELASEPPTPRAELLVAIVGPLTSFALAGCFYALGRVPAGPAWWAALTGYLTVVNLILGLFNLVPGFPLDGGRVLRALLWWGSGRWDWATRWASRAGSIFAGLLMALGVLRTFGGEVVGGLWFILIGLFLHQAAQAGHELARVRARLAPLRVLDVMTPEPVTVEAVTSLGAVLNGPLSSRRVAGFPVTRGHRLVGFLPWRRVADRAADPDGATAADAMVPLGPDDVVTPQASAWQAFLKVAGNDVGRVAVVDGGRLVGIVSRRDLQHALNGAPARDVDEEQAA
jgi:Zn-dependent protease/CBS domain-containing protein